MMTACVLFNCGSQSIKVATFEAVMADGNKLHSVTGRIMKRQNID